MFVTKQQVTRKRQAVREQPWCSSFSCQLLLIPGCVCMFGEHVVSELLWYCRNLYRSCLVPESVILQWSGQNPVVSFQSPVVFFWLRLPWNTCLRYRVGITAEVKASDIQGQLGMEDGRTHKLEALLLVCHLLQRINTKNMGTDSFFCIATSEGSDKCFCKHRCGQCYCLVKSS